MPLKIHQLAFLLLLLAVSIVYGLMLKPLFTSILWAALIAILFHPLQCRLQTRFGQHRNLLALTVLLICIIMVILPFSLLATLLAREGAVFYHQIHGGEIDLLAYVSNSVSIPKIVLDVMQQFGIDLNSVQQSLKTLVNESGSFIAGHALNVGQNTAQLVFTFILMLYLTFFFLRDGEILAQQIIRGLPLGKERENLLMRRIADVVIAVVRGGLLVAMVQGTLGGLIFWMLGVKMPLLWGVTMVFASLVPAVGASLIWAPVAIYLMMNGEVWQGVVLALFGFFVIGLIDNILRPILVGHGIGVPDYVILVSTLGGILLFGVNGFLLGPLIVAMFITLWTMFINEYNAR